MIHAVRISWWAISVNIQDLNIICYLFNSFATNFQMVDKDAVVQWHSIESAMGVRIGIQPLDNLYLDNVIRLDSLIGNIMEKK